jgi:cytochrome c peroxidase
VTNRSIGRFLAISARSVGVVAAVTLSAGSSASAQDDPLAALGRALFFDQRLSRSGLVSCASCHQPDAAFADGVPTPMLMGKTSGARNTLSLQNVGRYTRFGLDGGALSLAEKATSPFFKANEHGLSGWSELTQKLLSLTFYDRAFVAHRPPESDRLSDADIRAEVESALTAYLRTLSTTPSAFDRWRNGTGTFTPTQARGFALFVGRAECGRCHIVTKDNAPLTDSKAHTGDLTWHALSVGQRRAVNTRRFQSGRETYEGAEFNRDISALGLFLSTRDPTDIGRWRTPSLRGVAATAPYMHDGGVATLGAAIRVEVGRRARRDKSRLLDDDIQDIEAFLRTL